ncbi:VirB4 family type IV secretion system protein [Listeria booriae]|uniref:Type IV secretion system protein VirB4 n=1 Tax=Listeria booriae TaxID=1552123 RepID=A0A7X0WGL3_9LIST|nr:type IV secretion system protein VirB4 [Listeria booriae]MBC1333455.1 type IV secretion system protein VirB4 [Listeria booriae]MBC2388760.1 type IV secretion system protein VirB4 [Listeria booriae]
MVFRKKKKVKKSSYNPAFLAQIQPQGGFSNQDFHVRLGDGRTSCITIYDYPVDPDYYWLIPIMSMDDSIVFWDLANEDKEESRELISKSLDEQGSRQAYAKKAIDAMDAMDALDSEDTLRATYKKLKNGEVNKLVTLHIYVHAYTQEALEEKENQVLKQLNAYEFQGTVHINEQLKDIKTMLLPYKEQQKLVNARKGRPIPTDILGASFPFHFKSLKDPFGSFWGYSSTNGVILLDTFHNDGGLRISYDGVLVGRKGSGKSTAIKKLLDDRILRGDVARGFDVTGEFKDIILSRGGKIIALDGTGGKINPLQAFATIINEDTGEIDEVASYEQHKNKVANFLRYYSRELDAFDISEFNEIHHEVYVERGLYSDEKVIATSQFPASEYPIFSDILEKIRQKLYINYPENQNIRPTLSSAIAKRLDRLEAILRDLVGTYGSLFNGHSDIENFDDEQLVCFYVGALTSKTDNVMAAQLFNVMNLLWDDMVRHGKPFLKAWNRGEIEWEDIVFYLLYLDEAHKIINTTFKEAVEFFLDFVRQDRKYFGGLWLASQGIHDFYKGNQSDDVSDKITELLRQTTYQFIMNQQSSNLEAIRTVFGDALTETEIQSIPKLNKGEAILSTTSDTFMMNIELTEEEDRIFAGGR